MKRCYQENYTANMWKYTKGSKEFFPEASVRNELRKGPAIPLQCISTCVTGSLTPRNSIS